MSIAAYATFRALDMPVFYVHPENDRLIWLHPSDRPSHQLADRIRLEEFLRAHGAEVRKPQRDEILHQVTLQFSEELVSQVERFAKPLRTLNWLAQEAKDTLISDDINDSVNSSSDFRALVDHFRDAKLLERHGRKLRFPNESSRQLVNGGWLELHVHQILSALRNDIREIHDVARGVIVERSVANGKVENELDVALLCRNRLHIIECKTRHFREDAGESGPGPEALFKLDALGDLLGGLRATAMLVSYQKLGKATRRRATDMRIKVCCGSDLRRLREHLRDWLASKR